MNQMEKLLEEIEQEYLDGNIAYHEYKEIVDDILNDFNQD